MEESELIDKFLKDELNQESLVLVTDRMNSDKAFKAKTELRKIIIQSIHLAYEDKLRVQLKDLNRRMDRKQIFIRRPFMIAAILIFLATISIGVWFYFNRIESKIAKYDLYESGIPNKMGEESNARFVEAMNLLKSKDYAKALKEFEELKDKKSDTIFYFLGVCAFKVGNTDEAINYFKQVDRNSKYYAKATYRLGIAYWKSNQIDLAIPFFMQVTQDSTEYGANARKILTEEF